MKIKTSEATGKALDWLVAQVLGSTYYPDTGRMTWPLDLTQSVSSCCWFPSSNWTQAGPIIERDTISVALHPDGSNWMAWIKNIGTTREASTPLIAAMRCFVASKLGDEVEVPEELA